MKRGEVYVAVIEPRSGSEQRGKRPVVIVSHDGMNSTPNWNSLVVVPVSSSSLQGRRVPTVVTLPTGTAGLTLESLAVCHQVTTLDRRKLSERLGELPADLLAEVGEALKRALALT